jgi:hypothetical protein
MSEQAVEERRGWGSDIMWVALYSILVLLARTSCIRVSSSFPGLFFSHPRGTVLVPHCPNIEIVIPFPMMGKSFPPFLLFVTLTLLTACDRGRERTNVLTGDGQREVTVMDFSAPFSLDPLPAGWYHRTFWTRGPMQMAFAVKGGVPALRFETRSTASMLFRHVDLDLADYQVLIWRWYIEEPIESPLDEHTREGDDHPARLFLVFQTATGDERRMEIIWGNKLKAGGYKYIGGFPHYAADGGDENIRQWRSEEVDLREVYRHIWPDGAPAHLIDIAIFCDSDETHGHTVSYFADVKLRR